MRRAARPGEAPVEGNGEKRVQKVLSGRRVTIPSEVASELGLKEGDQVEVDYGNGAIIIKPVKEVEEKPIKKREASGESNSAKEEEK
ncbi:MAG TPA: AbrB/MazE/SpoVT family DNA-binding domain-containing protein [Nitrososphaeria archaeon]|nr:AbrB/MazE/SpoVT family DNA-binding domain-containing protein [Nitrososphaeria archaeon]